MLDPRIADKLRDSGRRVIVTGASGWVGRATVAMLYQVLGNEASSRVVCFGSSARRIEIDSRVGVDQLPLATLGELEPCPSILFHLAFLTKEKALAMDETTYRKANCDIASTVLEAAHRVGVDRIFLASSGAAKLADDERRPADFRLYGMMKREDEERFAQWALANPSRVVAIARIFNISGPYINKHQSYALASFIVDALAGRPIKVRATHAVRRAYVSINELLSLAFAILLENGPGVIEFETGGEPMELGAVAETVAAHFEGAMVERAPITDPAADNYFGEQLSYREILNRYKINPVSFEQQVIETARYLAAM